jgi:predicted amino acid dehydrogenase
LNFTSQQIVQLREARQLGWITEKIEEAVALARDAGCQVVGLGGYTSSVTANCRRVRTRGIALTSGNSLTVGMGILALRRAAEELGVELSRCRLAVLGIPGNIATTYAIMMAPHVAGLVFVVRDTLSRRVASAVSEVRRASPQTLVEVTDDLHALNTCSLVVAATISGGGLIQPEYLAPGPVIICDISVPADVAPSVPIVRPDAFVIDGGIVRLPFDEDFTIGGIPLERGHVFACMAETLLMGLEQITTHGSYGAVTPAGVETTLAMAEKHGFTLGRFKCERSF